MYHMTVRMKVCLKKVTSKSQFMLMFQLSNFLPLPITEILAILKRKIDAN